MSISRAKGLMLYYTAWCLLTGLGAEKCSSVSCVVCAGVGGDNVTRYTVCRATTNLVAVYQHQWRGFCRRGANRCAERAVIQQTASPTMPSDSHSIISVSRVISKGQVIHLQPIQCNEHVAWGGGSFRGKSGVNTNCICQEIGEEKTDLTFRTEERQSANS